MPRDFRCSLAEFTFLWSWIVILLCISLTWITDWSHWISKTRGKHLRGKTTRDLKGAQLGNAPQENTRRGKQKPCTYYFRGVLTAPPDVVNQEFNIACTLPKQNNSWTLFARVAEFCCCCFNWPPGWNEYKSNQGRSLWWYSALHAVDVWKQSTNWTTPAILTVKVNEI